MQVKVTSPAFAGGGMIPARFTCDGEDVSPPLEWSGLPEATASVAVICDDPDAPHGTWVHWVLVDLPANCGGVKEALPADKKLPDGSVQGTNDFKRIGYGGPCPPGGTHRYIFRVYALDRKLTLAPGADKAAVVRAMEGHILAWGELMARYARAGK